eukprot:jgi/Mesvir1/15961/Mv08276-RA.1
MPDIVSAVAELRGWGVAGGACLMLGPWVLWRSVAVCMVNLLNDLLWGVLRRVWKIFRFVSSMAATREFRDISFAVFIATMVIAAEVFTFGADGILLALRRPVACADDTGHDGDWEISLSGEDDMCDEGSYSDVGERLEETSKWDEDYYAAPTHHAVPIRRRRHARRKVKESAKLVDVSGFKTASDFAEAAFTAAANVWERMQRISYLIKALDEEGHNFSDKSVHAAEVETQGPKTAADFVMLAKSFSRRWGVSVEEKIARFQSLLQELRQWRLHENDAEKIFERDIAVNTLQKMVKRRERSRASASTGQEGDAQDVACEPGAILAYKRAAEAFCLGKAHPVEEQIEYLQGLVSEVRRRDDFSDEQRRALDPGRDQGQGDEGASDAAARVIQKLDADRKWQRDSYARKKREMATGRTKDVRGKKHARTDGNDADDSDGGCDEMDVAMEDDDGGDLEGGDGESIDPLEGGSPGSDEEKSGDDVSPPVKETDRERITRVNDEVKKFGTTLAEVRRLSRCMDTGDYAGFEVRPFKLQPLTNDPNAAHPYSLDEHRELSKCPKCHAPMFKEEHPKQSRCCSKGKVKVLQPNLNLIIEKRRRRERLLVAPNPDERAIAQNELTEQEEMLWQIHCNPTNVALWIRYGRMINQFFAVARVVASGRIGDAVENKGECVLELHGQTVERVKPIIRDGVHVNNDLYFLLNDPEQKDKAEDEVLERNKVKVKDPNLRRLLDLLEKYLLTYNPLLQQFARQAAEVLAERQAVVEVAGEFSPEVHAPEIFLMPCVLHTLFG